MHKSTRRWSVRVVSAVAAAGLLAACGGGNNDQGTAANTPGAGGSSAPAAQQVTLDVNLFGTMGYEEAGLFKQYMTDHPNIKINYTTVQQEQDYWTALQTKMAAGGAGVGDVLGIEVGRIATVVGQQADKWVDLNTLGADKVKDTFYGWKWDAATTKDGKTVGLGTDSGPLALCYRTDLFQQAGLPTDRQQVSDAVKTWDDYINLGKQYMSKAPKGKYFLDATSGMYNAMIGQQETAYYDANGNLIYDSNPAVKAAWDKAVQMSKDNLSAKTTQFSKDWDAAFSNGAFATIACPAWMMGYIQDKAGDGLKGKWDVASLPGGGGNWGGSYLGIPASSKHQQEAYDLIQWLTAPAQQVKLFTDRGNFPSSSKAAEDPAVTGFKSAYFNDAPVGQIFAQSASVLKPQVNGPDAGTIKDTISNGLTNVDQKGTDGNAAWQATLKEIKNALGQ